MTLLEIAIPTYNRPTQLERLLQSIRLQNCPDIFQKVSIAVYDNSLHINHAAEESLKQLAALGCRTSYVKNPKNIGVGANIAQAYARSSAAWTVVVGDDDYFMPFSISRILAHIEEAESADVGLIQLGFVCIDDQYVVRFVHPRFSREKRFFSPSDAIVAEGCVHDLSFISSLVVRSSIWSEEAHKTHDKPTQLYAHVFCLLDGLRAANLKAMCIDEHLVFAGYGRNDYYSSKVAVSRLSEFPAYDRLALSLGPVARSRKYREYRSQRFRRLKLDINAALKIGAFRDSSYKAHVHLIKDPQSPFWPSSLSCRAIYLLTLFPWIRGLLKRLYSSSNPGKDLSDVDSLV